MSKQYTMQSVSAAVDRAVRQRARREEKSLNTVVVEALVRGLELDATPIVHTDLDYLIGSWEEDPEFDRAVVAFERIDEDAWGPTRIPRFIFAAPWVGLGDARVAPTEASVPLVGPGGP